MSKRFLGLLLPFLLVYGIDDLDLDGLDLPQVEQEAKSEEKKPDEVEKVVVPLSEAKEAEESKGAEEAKEAEGEKSGGKVEAKAGDKTEEGAEAAQKEASQSSQNPATQESKGAEKQATQPQGENPQPETTQQVDGQKADSHSTPVDATPIGESRDSAQSTTSQGENKPSDDGIELPEELQIEHHETSGSNPAPQPKADDKLPEGFGPEDLPPEALDGVSGEASPVAGPNPATSPVSNATPNTTSPAMPAEGTSGVTPAPNPALSNQDPNAPAAPQGATPPASTQPKVQLEENAKQSDKKQDGKEVTFTQEDFFELDEDDFMLEKRDGGYVLKVLSLDLEAFVNGKSYNEKNQVQTFGVNENYTQITSHDGKIQEYKFFQKAGKKNTILNRVKVPLKKLDFDSYKLVMKDTPSFFDTTNCKVGIKKELRATLNQNKEVIIDLDIRRELRNTTKFKLFLDCPR